ncbi:MAG TPA: FtsQ-type POTRA domain-containing protein [Nitrospirota bacterium]|nr:FtsQ-type POTRA domain-containing protein [Nitrospirota bacterium]
MYFSQYKSKKSAWKKNSIRGQKNRKLKKGIVRFFILAIIIISVIPVVYLSDSVFNLASNRPYRQKTIQTSYMDKLFRVQSVRVTGNNFISMEELNPYIQQVKGVNIFKYDIEDLAKRLRNNSWIKDVSVRREPPSSIAVNIVERTPAVYVDSKGGLHLTDEEGTLLGEKEGLSLGLPVVYGISLDGTRTGEKSNSEALRSAIRVRNELSSLPWIELSQTAIEIDEKSNITLHLRDYRIRLGQDRYREKLLRFNEIANDLKGKGIPYKEVDLRFDNQVVVQTL